MQAIMMLSQLHFFSEHKVCIFIYINYFQLTVSIAQETIGRTILPDASSFKTTQGGKINFDQLYETPINELETFYKQTKLKRGMLNDFQKGGDDKPQFDGTVSICTGFY